MNLFNIKSCKRCKGCGQKCHPSALATYRRKGKNYTRNWCKDCYKKHRNNGYKDNQLDRIESKLDFLMDHVSILEIEDGNPKSKPAKELYQEFLNQKKDED